MDLCNKTDSEGDEGSRAKRQKLLDDNKDEASENTRHTSESLPKTLKEMALFIIDNCKVDTDFDRFRIIIKKLGEEKVFSLSKFESRELFREDITGYDEADFMSISFGKRYYHRDEFDADAALAEINSVIRNLRLKEWSEDPSSVPRLLWPEALRLANEAGADGLYRTLERFLGDYAAGNWK